MNIWNIPCGMECSVTMKKTRKSTWMLMCLALIYLAARSQLPGASISMREALGQQQVELRKIINAQVPTYYSDYNITSYKKLDAGKYEIGITGTVDYGTTVNYTESYYFTLEISDKEEQKQLYEILNFARAPLKILTEKDGEIFYFSDKLTGEYEFGMQQKGLQYYALLVNRGFNAGGDDWSLLGWSEGMLPKNWNDWIALQKQDAVPKQSFSVQEYEAFLPAYIQNLNKLADENYQLVYSMQNKQDRLFTENQKALLNEAQKVIVIEPPSKYEAAHRILVQAMYEIQKNAEGYQLDITNAIQTADKAYACFKAQRMNESFEESKYHELQQTTRSNVSSAEKAYYKIHPIDSMRSVCAMLKISEDQYAVYVHEEASGQKKTYRLLAEQDKNGLWQVTNKMEVRF